VRVVVKVTRCSEGKRGHCVWYRSKGLEGFCAWSDEIVLSEEDSQVVVDIAEDSFSCNGFKARQDEDSEEVGND